MLALFVRLFVVRHKAQVHLVTLGNWERKITSKNDEYCMASAAGFGSIGEWEGVCGEVGWV